MPSQAAMCGQAAMRGQAAMSGRSAAGHWRVTSAMVRRAGIGADVLDSLSHPELASWLERTAADRRDLDTTAETLANDLFALIGTDPDRDDQRTRPALVGLRRAVHRRRRPTPGEMAPPVLAALAPDSRRLLDHYLWLLDRRRRLDDELDGAAAQLDDSMIESLRRGMDAPAFLHGLAAASPSLAAECERWLRCPERRPQRKKIIRLAKYLARAAAKTSPYSTFTSVSRASWSTGTSSPPGAITDQRVVVELNGEFWDQVCAALIRRPEIADRVPIHVNTSLPSRPEPGSTLPLIGPAPVEPVVEIVCTPTIITVLQLVRSHGGGGTRRVVDAIAEVTGESTQRCGRFVARLIEAGVVYPVVPITDHDQHPWRRLADWLDTFGSNGLQPAAKLIAELADELETVVIPVDLPGQLGRLTAIRRITSGLGAELALPSPAIHHETAVAPSVDLVATEEWRAALADVDVARRWLTLFDAAMPARLMIADWFRRVFGDEQVVPFPEFYQCYRRALGSEGDTELRHVISTGDSPFPADLEQCRSAGVRELMARRQQSASLIDEATDPAVLSPGLIADLTADLPAWLQPPSSVGCYLQPVHEGDELHLVINAMHLGHGRAAGRMNRLLALAGLSTETLSQLPPELAEFGSGFGSSMNRCAHRADKIIDYPFGLPHSGDERVTTPADLRVAFDPDTGLLSLRTVDGAAITPVHLGMSAEFVLPPAARLLQRAFGPSLLVHPSAPPLSSVDVATGGGRPYYPRVQVGRAVVQRARWCIPGEEFPRRRSGEVDSSYLSRLASVLDDLGIDRRFFLRSWTGDRTAASKSRKPMYVDCASIALVSVMERALVGSKLVVIDEALPDPIDRVDAKDPAVQELFVELSDDDQEADR